MEDLEDIILNCQGDNEFGELLMFKDQVFAAFVLLSITNSF